MVNMLCLLQAIYHGKPVVGMPMLGDQASNADRVVAKVCVLAFASLEACNDMISCSKSVQLLGLPLE